MVGGLLLWLRKRKKHGCEQGGADGGVLGVEGLGGSRAADAFAAGLLQRYAALIDISILAVHVFAVDVSGVAVAVAIAPITTFSTTPLSSPYAPS
mgnify:CR=1 FL=1